MKANYYNNIIPQIKEGVDFPLNHVNLSLEQEAFVESIYESKEVQLKKEEINLIVGQAKGVKRSQKEFK